MESQETQATIKFLHSELVKIKHEMQRLKDDYKEALIKVGYLESKLWFEQNGTKTGDLDIEETELVRNLRRDLSEALSQVNRSKFIINNN